MPALAAITTLLAPFNFRSCDSIKLQPETSIWGGSDDTTTITYPVGPAPRSRTVNMRQLAQRLEFKAAIKPTFTSDLWLNHVHAVDSAGERFGCGKKMK